MRLLHLFWVLIFFSTALEGNAQINKLHFDRYNTTNGLSNNRVYSILQDKQGFLWFGTLDGLNRFDGYSFTIYRNIPLDSLSLQNNRIVNMFEDSKGGLWLLTKKNGISCFNPETEQFRHYKTVQGAGFDLFDVDIDRLYENKNHEVILISGIYCLKYDVATDQIVFVDSSENNLAIQNREQLNLAESIKNKYNLEVEITSIVDGENFKWIATNRNGLFLLQNGADVGSVERYDYPPFDNAEIKCIYKDQSGIIWIGTTNKGVFKHNPRTREFLHYSTFDNSQSKFGEVTIRAITDDSDGNLWIGTYNDGLIRFNRQKRQFVRYQHNEKNSRSLPNNMVRTLYTDINGDIWVGTYSGVSKFDKQTGDFTNYLPKYKDEMVTEPNDSNYLYFSRVYGFDNDYFGNLWIADWHGLSCFNPKTKKFKHYPASYFGVDNIREVFIDKNNIIWIGAEFGGLVQFNSLTEKFEHYLPNEKLNSLSHQNVFAIYESSDDKLYVSTFNGLSVLNRNTGEFTRYTNNDGLAGNMIYGILEDQAGNIWLTTTNGLSMLNPKTNNIINYSEKIGLQSNEFTEGAYYNSPNTHEMIIGGINGINIFKPDQITRDTVAPKVAITSLQLFNQPVGLNNKDHLLSKVINYTSEVTLKHSNKVISFEFTALHFAIPEENHFKYKLEGFDKDWVTTGSNRRYATYTNLKPGKYVFKVMASNSDNYWSTQPAELKLTILPPLWETWWACISYVIIIVVLMLLFRHYSIKSTKMKNALKLERIKREKSDELHQMKLNFFTNISHEYRTPLSLILGPLDDLFKIEKSTPLSACMHELRLIQANSHKMLHLTNQIIDLRKLEMGKMDMSVTQTLANSFIRQLLIPYYELARYNNITLICNLPDKPIELWIDQDKIEKALNNLLSNAIKYTHKGMGEVEVTLSTEYAFNISDALLIGKKPVGEFVQIKVKDNGVGIPRELLEKIFQQFYRIDSELNLSVQGSGIGLALVKEMVELHHGAIAVESIPQQGSIFYLLLPLGNKHFNKTDLVDGQIPFVFDENLHLMPVHEKINEDTDEPDGNKKTILLVEDNDELRKYTAALLNDTYHVLQAADGQQGVEMAFRHMPELIISDIMMPKKNGIELCKMLKSDLKTSHIQIVLLSAKTAEEDKIEGYQCKADDYIAKPFNKELLRVRVKNLIESRAWLIESLGEYNGKQTEASTSLNPLDQEFMLRVNTIIEDNMGNFNFNVEQLSDDLGMSRSNLHLKLKALTNQSASDYIRTIRLHQALILLKEKKMNINEIAYEVGFNTPSYFIKCFKEKHGLTPKEYCKV